MNERLHAVDATAERLSVSVWTVFQLIRTDKLRSVKIGQRRLIPETAINDYIAELQAQHPAASTADSVSA